MRRVLTVARRRDGRGPLQATVRPQPQISWSNEAFVVHEEKDYSVRPLALSMTVQDWPYIHLLIQGFICH